MLPCVASVSGLHLQVQWVVNRILRRAKVASMSNILHLELSGQLYFHFQALCFSTLIQCTAYGLASPDSGGLSDKLRASEDVKSSRSPLLLPANHLCHGRHFPLLNILKQAVCILGFNTDINIWKRNIEGDT